MFKLLLTLLLITITVPAWATQWRAGTGENSLLGSSNASDIDFNTFNSIVSPLDNLLATYCNQYLIYNSNNNINVSSGSVMVSNSDGSIRLMLRNASPTTVDWTMLDTGAEASNTTYYIYAIASTNSSTSATYKISASSASPSGVTYYYQIGSFLNDSNSNITQIASNWKTGQFNSSSSKTPGTVYQALVDGFAIGLLSVQGVSGGASNLTGVTDGSSTPSTIKGYCSVSYPASGQADHTSPYCSITMPVKAGDYYEISQSASVNSGGGNTGTATMYFMQTQ